MHIFKSKKSSIAPLDALALKVSFNPTQVHQSLPKSINFLPEMKHNITFCMTHKIMLDYIQLSVKIHQCLNLYQKIFIGHQWCNITFHFIWHQHLLGSFFLTFQTKVSPIFDLEKLPNYADDNYVVKQKQNVKELIADMKKP